MTLILSGTDGLSDVDGSAATPAVRGTDTNTGLFFPAADTIAFAEGGAEVARITNTGAWSFGASGTATGTNGQVLTSAGSGAAPAWQTPIVTSPAGTTGQVQINNAGAFGAVGSGTTGQVLTSQGTGAAPVFATLAPSAMVLIATRTASASSNVTWTGLSGYNNYFLLFRNVVASASTTGISFQVGFGATPTYITSGYSITRLTTTGATITTADNASSTAGFVYWQPSSSNMGTVNGFVYFSGATAGQSFTAISTQSGSSIGLVTSSVPTSGNTITALQIFVSGLTMTTGTFSLYGVLS